MLPHPSKRYRLYIDETGTQTLKQTGIDRYLCLMGVVVRQDTHDKVLTPRLQGIKSDLFGHSATSPARGFRKTSTAGRAGAESAWGWSGTAGPEGIGQELRASTRTPP